MVTARGCTISHGPPWSYPRCKWTQAAWVYKWSLMLITMPFLAGCHRSPPSLGRWQVGSETWPPECLHSQFPVPVCFHSRVSFLFVHVWMRQRGISDIWMPQTNWCCSARLLVMSHQRHSTITQDVLQQKGTESEAARGQRQQKGSLWWQQQVGCLAAMGSGF